MDKNLFIEQFGRKLREGVAEAIGEWAMRQERMNVELWDDVQDIIGKLDPESDFPDQVGRKFGYIVE